MNILGLISVDVAGHPAACLLQDGHLVAFAEEERFVRVKQARGYFPGHAAEYCLREGELSLDDIDAIAFGWDCNRYRFRFPLFLATSFLKNKVFGTRRVVSGDRKNPGENLGSAITSAISSLVAFQPKHIRERIVLGLRRAGLTSGKIPPVYFIKHHLAHAATAFYCSGFDEAAILVFDGHGEENAVTIFSGSGTDMRLLKEINIPHSLGWFYSMFTEYLGWDPNEGEVKMMGLAPFGRANPEVTSVIDDALRITAGGIELNTGYSFYSGRRSQGKFFSDALVDALGPPRGTHDEITQRHKDIAFACQKRLEEAAIHLAKLALELCDSNNLCIAGGVALNCKMNGEIHKSGIAGQLYVQPLAYDAGAALGAAMVYAMEAGDDCRFHMDHLYWGPGYSSDHVETVLTRNKLPYRRCPDIERVTAKMLAEGKIIGWFQGRLEAGPRALGNRSILADPRDPAMKDAVNAVAKFRESWRPFALSLQEEHIDTYLQKPDRSPFMVMAFDVVDNRHEDIQSAMHWIDHTTRPQTVSRATNPRYWQLLEEFRKVSGVPGVLNTSFNVKGEPVVCSPEDAIRTFYGTGIDTLVIDEFVVDKTVGDKP